MAVELTAEPQRLATPNRIPALALWTGNAISYVGNNLTSIAIPWFVYLTTGSAARTGIVAFFTVVPQIIATFFGGAVVDRVGQKRMSIAADLLSGTTVAMIPLLHHTIGLDFWLLLVLVFCGALFDAPGNTARETLIPDVAAAGGFRLEQANAVSQVVVGLTTLIGPLLAGLLIGVLGESDVLWVDAATFGVSALLIALAVPSPAARPKATTRYLDDVLAGFRFLVRDRLLIAIALTATVVNFIFAPLFGVVLPVYAKESFGDASDLGLLLAGVGAGALIGSILFGTLGHRLPRRSILIGSFVLMWGPLWALSTTPSLVLSIAATFVMGIAFGSVNPLGITIMQERVPETMRGRVLGSTMSLILLATPIGMLIAGALIEAIGVGGVIAAMAVGCLLTTISMAINPALRDMQRPSA